MPENAPVWQMVTSTRDNCLGSECPHYKECFVMRARKEAQQADVVVVNHHLFFADVVLRDTGMAELLPAANTVIFDEAHQLPETATLFFGETLSTSQLLEIARDTVAEGLSHARDAVDWVALAAPLERAARDLRLAFSKDNARLALGQIEADRRIAEPFNETLDALDEALSDFVEMLESQAERAESLQQCHRRALELANKLARGAPKPRLRRHRSRRRARAKQPRRCPPGLKPCAGSRCSRIPCSCTARRCRSRRSSRASATASRAPGFYLGDAVGEG